MLGRIDSTYNFLQCKLSVNAERQWAMDAPRERLRKKAGRPRHPPELCRSQRVVTFVTEKEMQQIRALADSEERPLSATAYELIIRSLSEL
jgi:hypothetical protein